MLFIKKKKKLRERKKYPHKHSHLLDVTCYSPKVPNSKKCIFYKQVDGKPTFSDFFFPLSSVTYFQASCFLSPIVPSVS